ncbi:hypothetical protein [Burkholderia plantarii]|uniref:hypothetical protein n=1 Tax=Burkholderia plantarii TaxID=41899 RepID=UPI0018DCC80A|nr:hypothetical protein [Burkholderia plantarii]MBI0331373.1 hypothetical protein [Burkholderia plantarii]
MAGWGEGGATPVAHRSPWAPAKGAHGKLRSRPQRRRRAGAACPSREFPLMKTRFITGTSTGFGRLLTEKRLARLAGLEAQRAIAFGADGDVSR